MLQATIEPPKLGSSMIDQGELSGFVQFVSLFHRTAFTSHEAVK